MLDAELLVTILCQTRLFSPLYASDRDEPTCFIG